MSKRGELLVKDGKSVFTGKEQFKLYDKQTGELVDYMDKDSDGC